MDLLSDPKCETKWTNLSQIRFNLFYSLLTECDDYWRILDISYFLSSPYHFKNFCLSSMFHFSSQPKSLVHDNCSISFICNETGQVNLMGSYIFDTDERTLLLLTATPSITLQRIFPLKLSSFLFHCMPRTLVVSSGDSSQFDSHLRNSIFACSRITTDFSLKFQYSASVSSDNTQLSTYKDDFSISATFSLSTS